MNRPSLRRSRLGALSLVATLLASLWVAPVASAAQPTDLLFSEYIEGGTGQFAKAVEIFNGTGAPVDLVAGMYAIDYYTNGSATASGSVPLTGSIPANGVLVVAHPSSVAPILAVAAIQTAQLNHNGNDILVLRKGATVLDVIGQIGDDPGVPGWGTGLTSTADHTLVRKAFVTAGDTNGADPFDPALEWDGFADGTYTFLGAHTIDTDGTGGDGDEGDGEASGSGTVTADVTLESAAACIEIDHATISFGTLDFGTVDAPATPDVTITNCSTAAGTLHASATNATGPGAAAWTLVTAGACGDGLGTDEFRLDLTSLDLANPVDLSGDNSELQALAPGQDTTHTARIDTACPGSSGDGVTMTLSITYLATAD